MKNLLRKYFLQSSKLFIVLFLLVGLIYAFVETIKWNKTFDSYWGFGYFMIALAIAIFFFKTLVTEKK